MIRSRDRERGAGGRPNARWTAAAVTVASAVVAMCCATRERPARDARGPAPAQSASAAAAPEASSADTQPASDTTSAPAPEPAFSAEDRTKLPGFHAALRDLERKTRRTHVRVLWFGDSHAQADFWTGAIRSALQKRFGDGGIGYVYVGAKEYRHDALKLTVDGKWGSRPKKPSTSVPSGDRIYGLGGVLLHPVHDARVTISVTDAQLPSKLSWDLCYRLDKPGDEFSIRIPGAAPKLVRATAHEPAGPLRHLAFTTDAATPAVEIVPKAGQPEFCGVVIEADPAATPGVIVDTLGIVGAKAATILAWDEATWTAELARRDPDLVVLQYGTNEATDFNIKPTIFGKQLKEVVTRIRRVKPDVDCLVVGPTDRADREDVVPGVRDAYRATAREVGCGFWDTYAAMGGRGSILAWKEESPPRAARDGIHLTPKGYRDLGEQLVTDLLKGVAP